MPAKGDLERHAAKHSLYHVETDGRLQRHCLILAIVTEWREFRSPDFDLLRERLAAPVIFDGRNLYDPDYVERLGFEYYAIGRGRSVAA